jgi:hypothetical protein
MAIKRPDTPLASTNDDENKKPVITRTEVKNPDGTTTYRQSWNNETVRKQITSSNKPRKFINNPNLSNVRKKEMSSKTVTPDSREITTVPIPKAAGRTDNEIKAPPIKIEAPVKRSTREDIIYSKRKKENETREEFNKRDKEEDERVNKNALKNQRKGDGNEGSIDTGKNKGTSCRTC